ncbi:MAG: branched-chain amino acid ABC transporter substrate-binding protein [Gammaproteobacteria bacterium]|nr:branched-chain amino acid ABC transporter substrate-binding protein [Gammaproteobacteria bacterium]MDH5513493.1 branched-chain amino acid ABC transporter substrate-binding protein [Gammaproteobacteria bacterium]
MTKWTLGLIALAVALTACEKKEETATGTAAGEMTVKIGQVSPLTGPQAHLGKDNDNGARLAIDEINAAGVTLGGKKVKFVLVSEDDIADPRTATVVAQKLVDQRVAGVIGHLNSGTSIPASKIYYDAGIPQISPSATAISYTAQGFKTAFRVMTNDRQQGKVLGEYAVNKMGAKRVAIIDDRTAYGQGLADEVEKAVGASGGEIVAREFTTDRSTDFLAILTSIKSKNPDLVFYGGMDAQGAPMAKQLHSLGIKAKFLGGDGVQTAEFLKLAGSHADGVTASSPGLPIDSMPGGKEFRQKFTERFGTIQTYAPYAYDAVNVMVDAMKLADSFEPARYLAELPRVQRAGVTGNISFDEKGDIRGGAITLYQVRDGKWQVLETVMGGGPPAMEKDK